MKPSVLFVCVANSCRSQMAEAIARSIVGDAWEIWSAGSHPGGRVHPVALQAMQDMGLDLSTHWSKGLRDIPDRQWDYVVTMGCLPAAPGAAQAGGDACPNVPARHRLDWRIPDPVGLPFEQVRQIRDDLAGRVTALMGRGAART